MAYTVRGAGPADARAIAEIHVASWQVAYRGLIPDRVLDNLSVEERAEKWRGWIEEPDDPEERIWIAEGDGGAVGFAAVGPTQDPVPEAGTAEVLALYVRPDVFRSGAGRALLTRAVHDLTERGYRVATLWVHERNQAGRRFYEALGWRPDGSIKQEEFEGAHLPEVRYRLSLTGTARP